MRIPKFLNCFAHLFKTTCHCRSRGEIIFQKLKIVNYSIRRRCVTFKGELERNFRTIESEPLKVTSTPNDICYLIFKRFEIH